MSDVITRPEVKKQWSATQYLGHRPGDVDFICDTVFISSLSGLKCDNWFIVFRSRSFFLVSLFP